MFVPFTSQYHLGRLYIVPDNEEDYVRMGFHEMDIALEKCEFTSQPVTFKIDETHVPVYGSTMVGGRTLHVPSDIMEELRIDRVPILKEVLLATKTKDPLGGNGFETAI